MKLTTGIEMKTEKGWWHFVDVDRRYAGMELSMWREKNEGVEFRVKNTGAEESKWDQETGELFKL